MVLPFHDSHLLFDLFLFSRSHRVNGLYCQPDLDYSPVAIFQDRMHLNPKGWKDARQCKVTVNQQ